MKRALILSVVVGVLLGLVPRARMRAAPVDLERGHVALGLALRRLANTGVFMMATAHPDDENNGLLMLLSRGLGVRATLATATRGNGGQNEIGPELFEALGVLRTEELAAIHRFDDVEQYFTRAVDFGYSFSIEETFDKWGRDEIIRDYVRLIRTIRPDVMTGLMLGGTGGGQHHQASAVLAREAFLQAGDATKYPDQLQQGLRPWQPKKFYATALPPLDGRPVRNKLLRVDVAAYDSLLGQTYAEMGAEARGLHKSQGTGQFLALAGPSAATFELVESAIPGQMGREELSLFDGIDTSIRGLARLIEGPAPQELVDGLAALSAAVDGVRRGFESAPHESLVQPLLAALRQIRALRGRLAVMSLGEAARYDVDLRLAQKEFEIERAILLAGAVRIDVLADDGVVVPGQAVRVSLLVANRGSADVTVKRVRFSGFNGDQPCALREVRAGGGRGRGRGVAPAQGPAASAAPAVSTLATGLVVRCDVTMKTPMDARVSEPYWHRAGEEGRYSFDSDAPFGLSFRPTPFQAHVTFGFHGNAEEVAVTLPVQYRYEGDVFGGEKRTELLVVPPLSVRVSPGIAIVPTASLRASSPSARSEDRALPVPDNSARSEDRALPVPDNSSTNSPVSGRGRSLDRPADRPAIPTSAREIRVTVISDGPNPAETAVTLRLPAGWTASPAGETLRFSRQGESRTARFMIVPARDTRPGEYHVRAVATSGGRTFDRGYQTIEYPHVRRRHIYHDADITVKVIDVETAPNLRVGYVAGVGDEVPAAIEQLGVGVDLVTADDLAWGDLSRFDAIVTGVRAYERRADLRANNNRLLEYVEGGGTLVVQYNKFEFNEAQYGPYPAQVSGERITDEHAPVTVLAPGDPLLTFPNRITDVTWKGWVQERGLYFLGTRDSRYRDIVSLEDPFPNNKGEKRGALVSTTYGRGRWVYVGLGLWRQVPAGTDGAYQLLANLISTGKAR